MPKRIAPLLGALILVLLSGCVPVDTLIYRAPTPTSVPGTELPFDVVMQSDSSAYTGSEPAVFLATSSADAQIVFDNLKEGYREEFSDQVQKLDESHILVALFREQHGGGGYEIRANRVMLRDDELNVYAELCDAEGGRGGVAMVTQYFQIVQVTLPLEAEAVSLKPILIAYPVDC